MIWPCDGAFSRQNINCHRPLVVEKDDKYSLPAQKFGLADLVSLGCCFFYPAMHSFCFYWQCCKMVPRFHFQWWHPSYMLVHPAQNGWVSPLYYFHVDIFVHWSAYGVLILQLVSEIGVLCGEFSEVLQTKEKVLHLLLVYRCMGLLSWAWPQQATLLLFEVLFGWPFGLSVLFPLFSVWIHSAIFWLCNVNCLYPHHSSYEHFQYLLSTLQYCRDIFFSLQCLIRDSILKRVWKVTYSDTSLVYYSRM